MKIKAMKTRKRIYFGLIMALLALTLGYIIWVSVVTGSFLSVFSHIVMFLMGVGFNGLGHGGSVTSITANSLLYVLISAFIIIHLLYLCVKISLKNAGEKVKSLNGNLIIFIVVAFLALMSSIICMNQSIGWMNVVSVNSPNAFIEGLYGIIFSGITLLVVVVCVGILMFWYAFKSLPNKQ